MSYSFRASLVLALCVALSAGSPRIAARPGSGAPSSPEERRRTVPKSFELLGHVDLGRYIRYGDVFFYDAGSRGRYAYMGTSPNFDVDRPCGRGVKIFDVARPRRPRLVGTARGFKNADYEDVAVGRIGRRDVLAVGIQPCGRGPHGLALYDVSDPSEPRRLAFHRTPPHGVHELDITVRDDGRALVLVTVPHSEREGTGGDVRIVEVTDPRRPVELSDWGIVADSTLPVIGGPFEISHQDQGIGAYASNLAHGVRATDSGMTMYVSHWDAGVLKFDISDPAAPRLVGRTTFELTEDGDAHSAAILEANGTRYVLQNNEEISHLSPPVLTSSATAERELPAVENEFMPTPLSELGVVTAEVADANDGCEAEDFAGSAGKIALFDTEDPQRDPRCPLARQVLRALRAGVAGFVVNFVADFRPTAFRFFFFSPRLQQKIAERGKNIPSAMISDIDGGAAAMRAAAASEPVTVTLTPTEPSWGFLEIFSEDETVEAGGITEYQQVGEFSDLPHVVGDSNATFAWYTIHNTETIGNISYSSWYAHGIVALDLTDPTNAVLLGRFVPRPRRPAEMWGVAVDPKRGIVYGSDIETGLWIVRLFPEG